MFYSVFAIDYIDECFLVTSFMKYYSEIFEITLVFYLPVLDGEVGEELEEHEPAVDVFVVGAVA